MPDFGLHAPSIDCRVMATRVLLADDHAMVRQGLRLLLQREGLDVVGEAADGQEAVRLATENCPDVAVLDYGMPVMNGLGAAREIMQTCPLTKVILLTMHTDDHYVLEALQIGVKGYVVKNQAINEVLRGLMYLSPRVSRLLVEAYLAKSEVRSDRLTSREREVLQLVASGKTTKEIAGLLGISVKTAESHRTHILRKLEAPNTAGIVRYAIRQGLIQD